jgi:hypothetical protein
MGGGDPRAARYALDVELLSPDPDGAPDPDGGVPPCEPEPLPMSGQFLVDPDPELEPELELDPEFDPELPLFELDEGDVVEEEPDVELVPEFPEAVDVVAALATSAPPASRPEVSAPTARTLRKRMCMTDVPFVSVQRRPAVGRYSTRCAPDLSAAAERRGRVQRVMRRTDDDSQHCAERAHRPRHGCVQLG